MRSRIPAVAMALLLAVIPHHAQANDWIACSASDPGRNSRLCKDKKNAEAALAGLERVLKKAALSSGGLREHTGLYDYGKKCTAPVLLKDPVTDSDQTVAGDLWFYYFSGSKAEIARVAPFHAKTATLKKWRTFRDTTYGKVLFYKVRYSSGVRETIGLADGKLLIGPKIRKSGFKSLYLLKCDDTDELMQNVRLGYQRTIIKPAIAAGYKAQKEKAFNHALLNYSEAIRIGPKSARGYYYRAWAHSEEGRIIDALADLNRALKAEPTYIRAVAGKGEMYEKLNLRSKAMEAYLEALELDPNDKESKEALKRLSAAGGE